MIPKNIQSLLDGQLTSWQLAKNNYQALRQVRMKELDVDGTRYQVQYNPGRIVSSSAKVDAGSIQERKCFLCPDNLPAEQESLPFKTHYHILVNPFPIFPKHLTIADVSHTPQRIRHRMIDMLDLASYASDYVVFYNGPKCGASAPDHAHFQAGNKGFLPIEVDWRDNTRHILDYRSATLWGLDDSCCPALIIESPDRWEAEELFVIVYQAMEQNTDDEEPMMNLLTWVNMEGNWVVCIFPRKKHRPSCYFAQDETNLLISPASVDLGGVFITPREEDFEKLTAADIAAILREVCLNPSEFRQLIQSINRQIR